MSFWDYKRAAQRVAKNAHLRDVRRRQDNILQKQADAKTLRSQANKAIGNDLYVEIPDKLKLTEDYVDCVAHNREFNDVYSDFYMKWFEDSNIAKFRTLAERVHNCHKYWLGDRYHMQRIFDVKSVNLCHDKFCVNCQHLKQASRLKRFTQIFEELRQDYDLYHLTITVPNVGSAELKSTIEKMFDAFKKLIRYFSGDAKIKDLSFKQYGYAGAVRCLEIVVNPRDYHPHIHAALLLRKDLRLEQKYINDYSYSYGVLVRKFSDLEILIQKLIYLCMNFDNLKLEDKSFKKIMLKHIEALPLGYSCTLNLVEGNEWHEVFKYVTKLTKDGMPLLTDEQFRTLYTVLHRCKVMQGYGLLYSIAENDDDDDEAALEYAKILAKLRAVEDPEENCSVIIDEVVKSLHDKNITYISKRQVQTWLNELAAEEIRKE